MSAIGIPDYAPKESPFWDNNDNIFEIHSNVLYGGGIEGGQNFITDDDFLKWLNIRVEHWKQIK